MCVVIFVELTGQPKWCSCSRKSILPYGLGKAHMVPLLSLNKLLQVNGNGSIVIDVTSSHHVILLPDLLIRWPWARLMY
jgi:hypothetical protein